MNEQPQRNMLDAAVALVRTLGAAGVPVVLWTVIFCTALWKSDAHTMSWMFKYLFRTWLALAGGWLLGGVVVAGLYRAWVAKRTRMVPEPVLPEPQTGPGRRAGE